MTAALWSARSKSALTRASSSPSVLTGTRDCHVGGEACPYTRSPVSDDKLYPILRELAYAPKPESAIRMQPGDHVGRFEILREIDRGSFGFVYEARDQELGRHVAIKTLRFLLVAEE